MTIIFNKKLGIIKGVFSGDLQTIKSLYGDEAEDYALIWDEINMPDDETVIHHSSQFIINVNTRQLEMIPVISSYPISKN